MTPLRSVIWHDLECGSYAEDLALWRELAASYGDPVLDVGAGTGRVSLDLARDGHDVTALDQDGELLAALRQRAGDLPVTTVQADARAFDLGRRFGLCVVPMQTIQLLGGADGRGRFLACVRDHLAPGAVVAMAIADELEPFDVAAGFPSPLPDLGEFDGVVYCSRPTAVRPQPGGFSLERRRETVDPEGAVRGEDDTITLDALNAATLEAEGRAAGLRVAGSARVPDTDDYVGSAVVILGV